MWQVKVSITHNDGEVELYNQEFYVEDYARCAIKSSAKFVEWGQANGVVQLVSPEGEVEDYGSKKD